MVLFKVLLVCPFSVSAVLLVCTTTVIAGLLVFKVALELEKGGWE